MSADNFTFLLALGLAGLIAAAAEARQYLQSRKKGGRK